MKSTLTILLTLVAYVFAIAQDEPGSQNGTIYDCGNCTFTASSLGTDSGNPACSGIGTDDVYFTFVAPAPTIGPDMVGIKMHVTGASFDVVIEFMDAGLTSLACVNDVAGVGDEELVYYGFTEGATYHARVHSAGGGGGTFDYCLEQLPELFLRPAYEGLGPSGDGYIINELIRREYFASPGPVEKTEWKLVCDDDGSELFREITGINTNLNLNSVGGVCYNKTYTVFCRVMIGGVWCGYGEGKQIIMEAEPTTEVQPVYCGGTYDIYQSVIWATFLSTEQEIEWEFTTDNGDTVFNAFSPSGQSILEFTDIPQMRYNKIYQVRVRANICGQWGPWSDVCVIITGQLPYTFVEPQYCNTTVNIGANFICEFVANATEYVWQLAPIECDDPEMVPIGPAQVFFTPGESFSLQSAEVEAGMCYRIGVKPFVGEQEGDYGPFCQIQVIGGVADGGEQASILQNDMMEAQMGSKVILYPNPVKSTSLQVYMEGLEDAERYSFDIIDARGNWITSNIEPNTGNKVYTIEDTNDLPAGMYFLRISDEKGIVLGNERFMVQ